MKHCAGPLRRLRDDLAALEREGLLRVPPPSPGSARVFCSNDYLGLAAARTRPGGAGAGASRLVAGNCPEHTTLERRVREWLSVDDSLVFTSGYAANVGLLSALARPGDLIVSDVLNHASIIDGARLSRARVAIVPHLDVEAVARTLSDRTEARAWVVTESYFSMDADSPDLRALRSVCDDADASLIVDEAHAVGVLGPDGRGLCAAEGVVPDALVGTFGKAFGAGGAFVAGSRELCLWLWNRARSFVFSTGLSPVVAETASAALGHAQGHPELRHAVGARAEQFRRGLRGLGIAATGFGHIVPWIVGEPARAVRVARLLLERGIFVQAIRPPSVPTGTARLRFTASAAHTTGDVEAALAAVEEVLRCADA